MTDPTPHQIEQAIQIACIVHGCSCEPDITVYIDDEGLTVAEVAHDNDCPCRDLGREYAHFPTRHGHNGHHKVRTRHPKPHGKPR